MKRLLLGPLVALISSLLCLGINLLVAQLIKSPPESEPIRVESIDAKMLSDRHSNSDFVIGVCLLHQVPMKRGKAERYSGSSLPDEVYAKAREELFPNTSGSSDRPIEPSQERDSLIQYCEKCKEAEARWVKAPKER